MLFCRLYHMLLGLVRLHWYGPVSALVALLRQFTTLRCRIRSHWIMAVGLTPGTLVSNRILEICPLGYVPKEQRFVF